MYLLWLLMGWHALATTWPESGLEALGVSVGEATVIHEQVSLSLPVLTPAATLFDVGMVAQACQLRRLARRTTALFIHC